MTKLEELKAAWDAASDAWDAARVAAYDAYKAYRAELKKQNDVREDG